MGKQPNPRRINVVVDNDSWILPFAEDLVSQIERNGETAFLVRKYADIRDGEVAFFLGCIHVASAEVLSRNKKNLVVHASDLPKGRGFSPLTWAVLNGENSIPVVLLEAEGAVDSGPIVYRDAMQFEGHELANEMRVVLGQKTVELCIRYLNEAGPVASHPQIGEPTILARRRPNDSELDVNRSIRDQFNLLRVVDNDKYPAFFELNGHRYLLKIEKSKADRDEGK